ncbi:MAG: RND transporter MFP subunit [Cyclobacteriaceae bacterium]|nr:MAG: RND transporter MFP subunit [Cyclobacteriaceae bacterium]
MSQSEEETEAVETEKPERIDIMKKTTATGSIVPRKEIDIKSQVSGVVETIYIEPGQVVSNGQLLAKIRIIPDMVNLNSAQSDLKTARLNFENAKREKERQEVLFKDKIVSEVEYNRFLLDYNLSRERLEAAESNVQLIKEGASRKSGQTTNLVRATADGMVLDVPVREGSFVIESNTFNEGTTIASVADMNAMIFEGMVDEADIGKVKEGMELILIIGAIENKTFNATLEYVSPKGIEEEGAIKFEVRANVALDRDNFIRAGYSANADIVLEKKEQVLAIKESNLIVENDTSFVEIKKENQQFERILVKTGLSDGVNVEVISGLSEADHIKKL